MNTAAMESCSKVVSCRRLPDEHHPVNPPISPPRPAETLLPTTPMRASTQSSFFTPTFATMGMQNEWRSSPIPFLSPEMLITSPFSVERHLSLADPALCMPVSSGDSTPPLAVIDPQSRCLQPNGEPETHQRHGSTTPPRCERCRFHPASNQRHVHNCLEGRNRDVLFADASSASSACIVTKDHCDHATESHVAMFTNGPSVGPSHELGHEPHGVSGTPWREALQLPPDVQLAMSPYLAAVDVCEDHTVIASPNLLSLQIKRRRRGCESQAGTFCRKLDLSNEHVLPSNLQESPLSAAHHQHLMPPVPDHSHDGHSLQSLSSVNSEDICSWRLPISPARTGTHTASPSSSSTSLSSSSSTISAAASLSYLRSVTVAGAGEFSEFLSHTSTRFAWEHEPFPHAMPMAVVDSRATSPLKNGRQTGFSHGLEANSHSDFSVRPLPLSPSPPPPPPPPSSSPSPSRREKRACDAALRKLYLSDPELRRNEGEQQECVTIPTAPRALKTLHPHAADGQDGRCHEKGKKRRTRTPHLLSLCQSKSHHHQQKGLGKGKRKSANAGEDRHDAHPASSTVKKCYDDTITPEFCDRMGFSEAERGLLFDLQCRKCCIICESSKTRTGATYCKSCYGVAYKRVKGLAERDRNSSSGWQHMKAEELSVTLQRIACSVDVKGAKCSGQCPRSAFHHTCKSKCRRCRFRACIRYFPDMILHMTRSVVDKHTGYNNITSSSRKSKKDGDESCLGLSHPVFAPSSLSNGDGTDLNTHALQSDITGADKGSGSNAAKKAKMVARSGKESRLPMTPHLQHEDFLWCS